MCFLEICTCEIYHNDHISPLFFKVLFNGTFVCYSLRFICVVNVIETLTTNIITNSFIYIGAANAQKPPTDVPQAIQYALEEMVQPVPELEADCKYI